MASDSVSAERPPPSSSELEVRSEGDVSPEEPPSSSACNSWASIGSRGGGGVCEESWLDPLLDAGLFTSASEPLCAVSAAKDAAVLSSALRKQMEEGGTDLVYHGVV